MTAPFPTSPPTPGSLAIGSFVYNYPGFHLPPWKTSPVAQRRPPSLRVPDPQKVRSPGGVAPGPLPRPPRLRGASASPGPQPRGCPRSQARRCPRGERGASPGRGDGWGSPRKGLARRVKRRHPGRRRRRGFFQGSGHLRVRGGAGPSRGPGEAPGQRRGGSPGSPGRRGAPA